MFIVTLDPGHGGSDRANRGYSGKYIEADGNLKIALGIRDYFKNSDKVKVYLTRDKDMTLSLTQRATIAARHKSDLFISIHSDANANINIGGVTVFRSMYQPHNQTIGEQLGRAVANAMGISFRGCKIRRGEKYPNQDFYTVINKAYNYKIPYIFLLERGFHSNPNEEKLLLDENVNKKVIEAISKWILNTFVDRSNNIVQEDDDMAYNSFVAQIQQMLNNAGYNCGKVDGIAGPKTLAAVEKAIKDKSSSYNKYVAQIQQKLNNAGYNCGKVDGIAGPKTLSAVELAIADKNNPALVSKLRTLFNVIDELKKEVK